MSLWKHFIAWLDWHGRISAAAMLIAMLIVSLGGAAFVNRIMAIWGEVQGFYLWLVSVLVFGLFLATFAFVARKSRAQSVARDRPLDVRDGMPKLVCKGVSYHKQPIVMYSTELTGSPVMPTVTSRIIGVPTFYHLKICNEPTGTMNREVAQKVAARVQVFHENGTPAANERLHRWEHSPGPGEAGKSADQLLPLDIPPSGIECNLDIAMKYDQDDAFYTPTNDTAMPGKPLDWREEDFKFPPGTYIAEIHFRGMNVVSNMKCLIVNKGRGSKLEITLLGN